MRSEYFNTKRKLGRYAIKKTKILETNETKAAWHQSPFIFYTIEVR
jgi:hypothetical protein